MGGNPPLGYDVKDRKLVVNGAEAETVRFLFARYLELRSVPALTSELQEKGVTTKCWSSAAGKQYGGTSFTRGALYHLLRNRVYIGEATHKGKSFPGQHSAIAERTVWLETQDLLTANAAHQQSIQKRSRNVNWLQGLLFDDKGNLMTPSYTSRSKGRHRYYVSQALLQHRMHEAGSLSRVPAAVAENTVLEIVCALSPAMAQAKDNGRHELSKVAAGAISRVEISDTGIAIVSTSSDVRWRLPNPNNLKIELSKYGGSIKATVPKNTASAAVSAALVPPYISAHTAVVKATTRAWRWRMMFESGEVRSLSDLAAREDTDVSYIKRILRLSFLSPYKQECMLSGAQSVGPSLAGMMTADTPLAWPSEH